MSLVDKYSNFLDDKKEAVVTTPFSEKKSLTTETFTTSYEMLKRIENLQQVRMLLKVLMRFTNVLRI